MSATSNDEQASKDATRAETAVDRHGDVYREWAGEDTPRGRLARAILTVGGDDEDAGDDDDGGAANEDVGGDDDAE
ncbi:hypothetical protein ACFQMF_01810 [Halorubrum rutilum]|uniref:Uncharacterized protein n=1 Tax=Halorubrum rutilum TaxID=1364933 RepID=A0ABD6AH83_9EURY|nr:hypothetical protein [Halorubrum rutilum]